MSGPPLSAGSTLPGDGNMRPEDRGRGLPPEFFRTLLEYSPDLVTVADAEGRLVYSTPAADDLLGYEPGERVGRSTFELTHPDDLDRHREDFEVLLQSPGSVKESELRMLHRDGGTRFVAVRARNLLRDPQVRGVVSHLRDMTQYPESRRERDEARQPLELDVTERAARARRAEFQARLLEAVGEAVMATDTDGVVTFWNRAAEKIYGWSAEEMVGRNVWELTDPRPVHAGTPPVDLQPPPGRWSGEYEVRRKDGIRIPVYATTVTLEEDGRPKALVGVSTDMSEMRRLEAQLRQSQKMEAVARLAGGIAHDFNNLLTTIGGYAAIAAEGARDGHAAADIAEVVNATERARGLVDKLLAFSQRSQTAPRAVDLNAVITGMVGMLRRILGERVTLDTQLAADLWPARTDPAQIEQVIVNLAVNARDAMPEGGIITLRTDRVVLDQVRVRRVREGMAAGEYVRLTVSDTGTGIEEEIRDRIFDPFFTTKEVGGGSGLGLSIVFGEVTRVGGGVAVQSRPGEGATFFVYLPVYRERVAHDADKEAASHTTARKRGEVILLVEDEEAVRKLALRVLEREGYTVLQADSGVAAERILATAEGTPDLLLTDVIMPGMGGAELAERLAESRPRLPVLYMSGYTADELQSRGLDESDTNFLPKPFTPAQLKDAVRRALPG